MPFKSSDRSFVKSLHIEATSPKGKVPCQVLPDDDSVWLLHEVVLETGGKSL